MSRLEVFCLMVLADSCMLARIASKTTVVGTGRDSQSAVVPGIDVTLKSVDTGIHREFKTRASGLGILSRADTVRSAPKV